MSELGLNVDRAAAKAEEEGFTVIRSDENHLLLDFDSSGPHHKVMEPPPQFYAILEVMQSAGFNAYEVDRWQSKSGLGLHVLVKLDNSMPALARVAIQAVMGSDPKRELLSVLRVLLGIQEPSLLFKPASEGLDNIPF